MENQTVLVTGSAGFIGSSLVYELLKTNTVIGIDSFTDYYDKSIKKSNLASSLANSNYTFHEADLNSVDLTALLKDVDVVFHEAAQAGVRYSWGEHFQTYIDSNIRATQKLLEAAKTVSLKKLVFASSSSVYGNPTQLPTPEIAPLNPISPYGVTKVTCEKMLYAYHEAYKTSVSMLRYFTVYGPRQRPDMGIHKFTRAFLDKESITIYGDGKQTRDFTYIDDIVQGTIASAEDSTPFSVYNLGGGSPIELNELLSLIADATDSKSDIHYEEKARGDVNHTHADITLARKALKYEPKVNIKEGVNRYGDWLNEFREIYH